MLVKGDGLSSQLTCALWLNTLAAVVSTSSLTQGGMFPALTNS